MKFFGEAWTNIIDTWEDMKYYLDVFKDSAILDKLGAEVKNFGESS